MLAKRNSVPSLRWAGFLVLVTAVSLAAGLRSAGAAEGWLVREQPGALQYRLPESSAWSPASPGLELQPGTTVRAGSGRPAVLARADSSIVIRGGTELTLPPAGTETVVQRLGSARYQIEPGTVSDFLVETPYLVIGIKGTVFDVLVNEAGTKVGVSEGLVEVMTRDGRFRAQLAPGQTARVGAATGSAPEVQSSARGADAPAPQGSTGSAAPDRPSRSDAASPLTQAAASPPTQAAASSPAEGEARGALSPLTSAVRSLWSGIGGLLSEVDVVSDDHLTSPRRGTLVHTLRGGIASVGSGARGDSGGGSAGGTSGGSSSSGAGSGGGGGSTGGGAGSSGGGTSGSSSGGDGSSSGGGGGSSSGGGSASSGSGSGGGGLGGAVGGVSGAVGGAVGGVSSAVGGAVGGGLGSAVGGIGKGLGSAVGGLGNGGGKRGKR